MKFCKRLEGAQSACFCLQKYRRRVRRRSPAKRGPRAERRGTAVKTKKLDTPAFETGHFITDY